MKISLGWVNKEGYSENQIKTFADEDAAMSFCKKHLEKGNIVRINGVRFHRDFEDGESVFIKEVPDVEILEAIRESE